MVLCLLGTLGEITDEKHLNELNLTSLALLWIIPLFFMIYIFVYLIKYLF